MLKKKYRVHWLGVNVNDLHNKLEQFLNDLEGEFVSIISYIKKGILTQIYGVTSRVDFLMIIEKNRNIIIRV